MTATVRVLTYNVQSCRAGIERVADVIRRAAPDVAAINEVRRGQARRLGKETGLHVRFGQTLRWPRYGNAVLSKARPLAVRSARFTVAPPAEPRGMIAVTLPGGLVVAAVHFGVTREERERQVSEFLSAVEGTPLLIVAGDLNDRPDGPAVRRLGEHLHDAFAGTDAEAELTFPAVDPHIRIDYVFVSPGIRVVSAAVLADVASDHLPVVADLEVPGER